MKNKKIYKVIACVSIWLSVIIAFFGLAIAKPKAGVIVESSFGNFTTFQGANAADLQGKYFGFNYFKFYGSFEFQGSWSTGSGTTSGAMFQIRDIGFVNDKAIMHARWSQQTSWDSSIQCYFTTYNNTTYVVFDILQLISNVLADGGTQAANITVLSIYSSGLVSYNPVICEVSNTISQIDNIFDLKQNDLAIIYISDVSGFDSSNYQPEITINWGYIDSSDNTVYEAHSPTVNVMKGPDDLEIWLNIPTDAGGTVYDSVILNQKALLTLITDGASEANANIYALYVWLLPNRIQWGLLNFNTAGLPESAQSMNYFTSYTTKYDYINTNTGTMTCRLSISDNFNFITIKNQPVFSVNTINTTLRQGGLLPAWALYNWARGTASGFVSGTQAGAAPYQPGNTGYNEIFQAGYDAGLTAQPAAAWYEAAFDAVDKFLNIHIFPSITFGELFGIPFVISVVYFIIRMFRGGGNG